MPIYKFSSPEGNEYYGEGADAHEAFQASSEADPFEKAAMRTRQSVRPSGGRGESEFTDIAEDVLVPGLGAVKSAAGGEYGKAAGQAALSALPFGLSALSPGARALAAGATSMMSPTATAGGMFDAEPDAKKRKAWEKQYNEAGTKGKREVLAAFNAQQSKVQEANLKQQEEERAAASAERERTAGIQRRTDWEQQNAEAIGKLPEGDRDRIKAAASLPEAQSLFDAAMERRRQAGMTLAERYPAGVLGGEALAVAGDIYAPYAIGAGRARALKGAADDAEKAYLRAYGPGSRASKATEAEAQLRRSVLDERTNLRSIEPAELAIGATVPYVAGNIPNAIDILMGSLSSDPAAKEKVQRAWESASDPMQFFRSIGVGLGATALGSFAAGARSDIGSERSRARGILNQFEARDVAAAEKAAAAAARKKELADAKAAAAAARTSSRETAAAERERIAEGNIAKTTYAAAAPTPLTPIQQAAADAEAAKEAAAAQRRTIRALKAGGQKSKATDLLSPGAAVE